MINRFLRTAADAVHAPDPLHLILRLECLCHALSFGITLHQLVKYFRGCLVDLLQMSVQRSGKQHSGIQRVLILPQVFPAARRGRDLRGLDKNATRSYTGYALGPMEFFEIR